MFEADALCNRIAVIDHGAIVAEGTPDALKRRVAGRSVVEVETFGADDATLERLRAIAGVASVTVEQREQAQLLVVQGAGPGSHELVQPLLHELQGVRVGRVSTREPTLEDAYVDLVST
jgi:ABC-2 type transport system ATP-binding protein